jgi:sarcosine oxidase subunit beta
MRPDVIIIGGGIHGCSAALHLAVRGVKATLVEKNYCGRHASGVNAGGVGRLGRFTAEQPLAAATIELWHHMAELVGDDCGFVANGRLKIAETEAEMALLVERYERVRALGHEHERLLDQRELREVEPGVAPHCLGAIHSPRCGHANPFRAVSAFRAKATELGQEIREGTRVGAVRRAGGLWVVETDHGRIEAPVLVNCAGAWADRIAAQLGEPVPLEVIAPMLMVTARMPPFMHGVAGGAARILSIKQLANGTVVIGGGYRGRADRDAETTELDYAKLAFNARLAIHMFPALAGARVVRSWAGIEALMPDGMPVIGPSATADSAYHAFGFSAHGFGLGPAVGAVIAELVATGATNMPIEAFRIDRFGFAGTAPS